jgi:hypothetical protein
MSKLLILLYVKITLFQNYAQSVVGSEISLTESRSSAGSMLPRNHRAPLRTELQPFQRKMDAVLLEKLVRDWEKGSPAQTVVLEAGDGKCSIEARRRIEL